MCRSSIYLGHSISITSTARLFRRWSYPHTTALHNSISGWHCTSFQIRWKTICSWYFGSSESPPLYFDMLSLRDLKLHRFKIILKPDLSTASLHVINFTEFNRRIEFDFGDYRICEDTLVTGWTDNDRDPSRSRDFHSCSVYTGSTSAGHGYASNGGSGIVNMLLPQAVLLPGSCTLISFCPASGRFVNMHSRQVVVHDVI